MCIYRIGIKVYKLFYSLLFGVGASLVACGILVP